MQVLLHEVDHKAGRVIAADGAWGKVGEHPRAGRAGADDFEHLRGVHTGSAGQGDRLRHRQEVQAAGDLVAELHDLAGADRTHVDDRLAHRFEDGEATGEDLGLASGHDGQGPGLRADVAAAHGSIEHGDAATGEFVGHAAGGFGGDGGTVDVDGTRRRATGDAVGAERDRFDIGRVGHAREGDLAGGSYCGGGGRRGRTQCQHGLHAGRRAVPHRESEARLQQVGGHGGAHDAEPDESDTIDCHAWPPVVSRAARPRGGSGGAAGEWA